VEQVVRDGRIAVELKENSTASRAPGNLFWAVYLAVFSVVDGFSTLFGLKMGAAREANPVMAGLYSLSPAAFICSKVVLGIAGPLTLWYLSSSVVIDRRGARVASVALVSLSLLYTLIVGMQVAIWHAYLVEP